jgi:hypothetical protein
MVKRTQSERNVTVCQELAIRPWQSADPRASGAGTAKSLVHKRAFTSRLTRLVERQPGVTPPSYLIYRTVNSTALTRYCIGRF